MDEAQDVTPLEWLLLDEINEADAWTILGDLNQRRSDHTLGNWAHVLDVIAIDADTPIRRMKRGYRSTKPILDFANRLLPRPRPENARAAGPRAEPAYTEGDPKELDGSVVREIKRSMPSIRQVPLPSSPLRLQSSKLPCGRQDGELLTAVRSSGRRMAGRSLSPLTTRREVSNLMRLWWSSRPTSQRTSVGRARCTQHSPEGTASFP